MSKKTGESGRPATGLLDQAVHLLRTGASELLPAYYFGGLPFVLGFLYFLADMEKSAFAERHLAAAALGLALLFAWMKSWQAVFCARVLAYVTGGPFPRFKPGDLLRVASSQTALAAMGFILLPAAALVMLPLPWVYAFFQNATALGAGKERTLNGLWKEAWSQAALWPGQNVILMCVVSFFSMFVLYNLQIILLLFPYLFKNLAGFENSGPLGLGGLADAGFLAVALGLTYLVTDPVIKTAYVLRCFHGASLETGQDLLVALKRSAAKRAGTGLVLVLVLSAIFLGDARASETRIPPAALDRAIQKVLEKREFAWRMPKKDAPEPEASHGFVQDAFQWLRQITKNMLDHVRKWVDKAMDWLEGLFPKKDEEEASQAQRPLWRDISHLLLWMALAVAVCLLTVFLLRRYRGGNGPLEAVPKSLAPEGPDLRDESLSAKDLPATRWQALASENAARGAFAEALRALFFSTLAGLSDKGFLTLARYKSNREYTVEVTRRTSGRAGLAEAFGEQVAQFDRVWYGMRKVAQPDFDHFLARAQRIEGLGQS